MPVSLSITVEPLLISVGAAADIIGIGKTLFLQLEQSGRIGPLPIKLGRRKLYLLSELREWSNMRLPTREKYLEIKKELNQ